MCVCCYASRPLPQHVKESLVESRERVRHPSRVAAALNLPALGSATLDQTRLIAFALVADPRESAGLILGDTKVSLLDNSLHDATTLHGATKEKVLY